MKSPQEENDLPKTLQKIPQHLLEKNGQVPFSFSSDYLKPIQEFKNLENKSF